MGVKDSNYKVVYRGERMKSFVDGGWAFFQRSLECGGGYWFGRTYSDCFWLEFEQPTSLGSGIRYILSLSKVDESSFDDDFKLT